MAELARQLVARLCVAHMQRAAAAVAAAAAGDEDANPALRQQQQPSPVQQNQQQLAQQPRHSLAQGGVAGAAELLESKQGDQQQEGVWHSVLSTLYEDVALAAKANALVNSSRAHTSKLAALLEGLHRSMQASAGQGLLSQVSTMVKDTLAMLGQRQLLMEGLLLASKQGAAVRSMLAANAGAFTAPPTRPGPPQLPSHAPTASPIPSSRASSAQPSRTSSMRGLSMAVAQQQRGADSTDSEDEEKGVVQGRQRHIREGVDSDNESDAASVRTVSSMRSATYLGGRSVR